MLAENDEGLFLDMDETFTVRDPKHTWRWESCSIAGEGDYKSFSWAMLLTLNKKPKDTNPG